MRKTFVHILKKISQPRLRLAGILMTLVTLSLAYAWNLFQANLYDANCDRTMPPPLEISDLLFAGVVMLPPFLLAQSSLIICFVAEGIYQLYVAYFFVATALAPQWECYTSSGSTDFGESLVIPWLLGHNLAAFVYTLVFLDVIVVVLNAMRKARAKKEKSS